MPRRLSVAGWTLALLLGCAAEPVSPQVADPEALAPIAIEVDPPAELEPEPEEGSPHEPTGGALDKDVLRRIVRAHVDEVRDCYNHDLATDPTLTGRIEIDFTIGPTGAVVEANVTGASDPAVSTCIADAILTWTFPKPVGGGYVQVSYPYQ